MSTADVLNAKLLEFNEWIDNLSKLDNNTIQQYQNEIKLKGRTFVKFHAEVKVLNDTQLMTKFSQLMQQFKRLRAISNGQTPPSPPKPDDKEEKKSESPESKTSSTKSCIMGKDCNSNDPKHYYDFIHFDHPKSDDMIIKYEKFLKKQKCKQLYEEHQNTKNSNNKNVSSEFSDFLTDEQLAQQLAAMQQMEIDDKPKRKGRKQVIIYQSDDEDKESSEEEDDLNDEDFNEKDCRRVYRRKIKNKKKENERLKLEEQTMEAHELEKLRTERLNKLLNKTEKYMKTLTRRVRKNFKQSNTNNSNNSQSELSANDVRSFLTGDSGKDEAIEQTKSLIGGTLKDYQQIGLKWMVTLNQMRLNGILADEMGLGKTVQVMALLAYILDNNNIRGKHLIVAPLSTLSSWRDHFADWLPSLKVYLHRGVAAERKEKLGEISKEESDIDVVVSTYQMVIRDAEYMSSIKWNYLIVDEAHTLKNSSGRLFESLNAFSTRHRLLLTGTPLQNNLNELWSLLNFILPAIFDNAQSFDSWFCTPFEGKSKDNKLTMSDKERLLVMDRLHRAIDPFLLRRMKRDVLPKMVKKEEIVIKVPISGEQLLIYSQLQKYGALKYKGEMKRYMFNNIMMQLRKCANHPYLFAPDEYDINDNIYRSSGKFVLLRHLIPKMKRFNHRILIFCQFVTTMDILCEFLDFINEKYLRIDGGTDSNDRIDYLEEFNKGESGADIFLLSTRACGLGLNLYSADTVILFDSDWNPQQDLQAMARCHRIGQKKEVRVFRLIADGTVEESIYDRAQKKLDLERKAIECGKFDFSITGKERKEFLQQILEQRVEINNKYAADIERKKLNQLLSRNENEWKEFEKMDKKNKKKFVNQLQVKEVVPEWLELITTDSDPKEVLPEKRKRKEIKYNENEYWKNIMNECNKENESDEKSGKNKKKMKNNNKKRKRNEMSKDNNNGNNSNSVEKKKRKVV